MSGGGLDDLWHRVQSSAVIGRILMLVRRRQVQRVLALVLFGASATGLAVLIATHLDELRAASWRLEPTRLIAGILFQASTVGIATFIWIDLSHRLGASWDPRRDARAYAYALVARRLPGTFWHVLGRAAYYGDLGLGRRVGVIGSLIEAGLLVMSGVALGLIVVAEVQPIGAPAGALILLAGPPVWRLGLTVIARGRKAWVPSVGRFYLWTALDALAWVVGSIGIYLLFDALFPLEPWMWVRVLAASTVSIVGSALVLVLPGGLGLRELGMTGVLAGVIPTGIAAALAIAFRICITAIEIVWAVAVILLVRGQARQRADVS